MGNPRGDGDGEKKFPDYFAGTGMGIDPPSLPHPVDIPSLDEYMSTHMNEEIVNNVDVIENLETSTEWNTWRDTIAQNIMDARGSAIAPNVENGKAVRGRRSWSKVEEDALIHCLIDIVNDGWKDENGFKAGF
ncbi:hypothetical protein ACS0TY_024492 [Phlomoides rotata]